MGFNNLTSKIGFGVYHTGIVIYGIEYSYGMEGIFHVVPNYQRALLNLKYGFYLFDA